MWNKVTVYFLFKSQLYSWRVWSKSYMSTSCVLAVWGSNPMHHPPPPREQDGITNDHVVAGKERSRLLYAFLLPFNLSRYGNQPSELCTWHCFLGQVMWRWVDCLTTENFCLPLEPVNSKFIWPQVTKGRPSLTLSLVFWGKKKTKTFFKNLVFGLSIQVAPVG